MTGLTPVVDPFQLADTIQFGAEDPYPVLAEARRRAPVVRNFTLVEHEVESPGPAEWVAVLGYDEARAVLRDHETFSSLILEVLMGPIFERSIVALDEPEHTAHRALIAPAFRTKLLARWEHDLVARVVHELVDAFVSDGRTDLVRRFTFAFPVQVIARILGLPNRDIAQFQRWSMELISSPVNWERGMAASAALRAYYAGIVADRRRRPQDDLISELVERELDGQRLTDEEIFSFLKLLLPAGVETTYRSFGNLLFALLTHPDQFDAVRDEPQLRVAAIEEGLRWEGPILVVARRATRDAQLAGVDLPAGTALDVYVAAANRDERHYEHPDRFDVRRTPTPHLTFGFGPHMCLGMHLARMESRVALDAVIDRLPHMRLDPAAAAPRIVGSIMRSPTSLPVVFG